MRAFAELYDLLEGTDLPSARRGALERYFREAPSADAAWALWLLLGRRRRRALRWEVLRQWVAEEAALPIWLIEQCQDHVGDLAETLALLLPPSPDPRPPSLAELVEQRLLLLDDAPSSVQRALLRTTWGELNAAQRCLWHRLMAGPFRIGIARGIVAEALAHVAGVEPAVMTYRLWGEWHPSAASFGRLIRPPDAADAGALPYPFPLAAPWEHGMTGPGAVSDWQVEWMWDGLRAQLVRRPGAQVLWSREAEILNATFPEILEAAGALPEGTVLDGELLGWREGHPWALASRQPRQPRRRSGRSQCLEVPVVFLARDVLEADGRDLRGWPLARRRGVLEELLSRAGAIPCAGEAGAGTAAGQQAWMQPDLFEDRPEEPWQPRGTLRLSPVLAVATWGEVAALHERARAKGARGLLLKRRDAPYDTGGPQVAWWQWEVAPFTCVAVLVAVQPGAGRRAGRLAECTFGVWQGDRLVSVARADSGLNEEDDAALEVLVRTHATGRHGPLRTVPPEWVFELAFDAVAPSARHQAGLVLRSPRVVRWRRDKQAAEADTLETLRRWLEVRDEEDGRQVP